MRKIYQLLLGCFDFHIDSLMVWNDVTRAKIIIAKFLVLDEPTSALDPYNSSLLVKILKKLTQIGKGIVISTQDMDFLEQVMDRVYFLNVGKIVGISEKNAFDRSSLNALYLS